MSNRNYKAMGPTKLLGCYDDLFNQPEEDRDQIVALCKARGLVHPDVKVVPVIAPIKAGKPEEGAAAYVDSTFFKPMLAFPGTKPNDEVHIPSNAEANGWIAEPKLDGIRFIVHKRSNGQVVCYGGRNSADHTGSAPLVERAAQELPDDTIVDGELIEGKMWVFDIMRMGGKDLRILPFKERRQILERAQSFGFFNGDFELVPQFVPTQETFERVVAAGGEGIMLKRLDAPYRSGKRSRDMLKYKNDFTVEAVVTGFEMGKGDSNKHKVGAIAFTLIDNGAKSTCGYDCELEEIGEVLGKTIEVKAMGLFPKTGKPRHPRFVRMRPDRDPVAS